MPVKRKCPNSGAVIYDKTPEEAAIDDLTERVKTLEALLTKQSTKKGGDK